MKTALLPLILTWIAAPFVVLYFVGTWLKISAEVCEYKVFVTAWLALAMLFMTPLTYFIWLFVFGMSYAFQGFWPLVKMLLVLGYLPLIFFAVAIPMFALPLMTANWLLKKWPSIDGQFIACSVATVLFFFAGLGFQQVQRPLMKLVQWPFSDVALVARATKGAPYYLHYIVSDRWLNYRNAGTNIPGGRAVRYEALATINLATEKSLEPLIVQPE